MTEQFVLALDIGTRKVAGLLGSLGPDKLKVKAAALEEHQSRSMLDGQIQDIPEVSRVVEKVKAQLEKKTGLTLTSAAVAAAGRTLVTRKDKTEQEIPSYLEISPEDILALEFSAIQSLNAAINRERGEGPQSFIDQYQCVGYSVTNYYLDGSPIGSLAGQRGYRAGVEVIATFLPRIIVDSLMAVLKRTGLEMMSLTLEPIAALSLVVPRDMRKLNLALVDIGAGTSDIALTSGGSVLAYAMVPVAGDEITDYLCDKYLLDFLEGERVKKLLEKKEDLKLKNILGMEESINKREVLQVLRPVIENLAGEIAKTILELNGKPPQAVFCVGGGSLTPGLTGELALKLDMPGERVKIMGYDLLKQVPGRKGPFTGPELVTPMGIATTARDKESLRFIKVKFNGRPVHVLDLKKGTVLDVLLASGIKAQEIYSRPGESITVELNGTVKTIKGQWGANPGITVNEEKARLDTLIKDGDEIKFTAGARGEKARARLKDLVTPLSPKGILFHGEKVELPPLAFINGRPAGLEDFLEDRDKVTYRERKTLKEVLNYLGIEEKFQKDYLTFRLNGETVRRETSTCHLKINGEKVQLEDLVYPGDSLEIEKQESPLRVRDIAGEESREISLVVNGREASIPVKSTRVTVNGKKSNLDCRIGEGDSIMVESSTEDLFLARVLNHLNFNTTRPAGKKKLLLKLNGNEAEFTSPVQEGDRLDFNWE